MLACSNHRYYCKHSTVTALLECCEDVFDLGIVIMCRAKKEAELEKRFSGLYMEKEEAARQEEARKAAALEKSRQEDLKVS